MQAYWEISDLWDWENFRGRLTDEFCNEWIFYIDTGYFDDDDDDNEYFVAHAKSDRGIHWLSTGDSPEDAMNSLIEEYFND